MDIGDDRTHVDLTDMGLHAKLYGRDETGDVVKHFSNNIFIII